MTDETIKKINGLAESLYEEYELIGIRIQDVPFELGEMSHVSHIWDDGRDTGEELDGICAINIMDKYNNWTERINHYLGEHMAIICGNIGYSGEDLGEIVIEDPIVIEIIS